MAMGAWRLAAKPEFSMTTAISSLGLFDDGNDDDDGLGGGGGGGRVPAADDAGGAPLLGAPLGL